MVSGQYSEIKGAHDRLRDRRDVGKRRLELIASELATC